MAVSAQVTISGAVASGVSSASGGGGGASGGFAMRASGALRAGSSSIDMHPTKRRTPSPTSFCIMMSSRSLGGVTPAGAVPGPVFATPIPHSKFTKLQHTGGPKLGLESTIRVYSSLGSQGLEPLSDGGSDRILGGTFQESLIKPTGSGLGAGHQMGIAHAKPRIGASGIQGEDGRPVLDGPGSVPRTKARSGPGRDQVRVGSGGGLGEEGFEDDERRGGPALGDQG